MSAPDGPFTQGVIEFQYVEVFFAAANDEVPVSHRLTGQYVGWTLVGIDTYARVKNGQMPPASNVVQLVCDTANVTATIRVEAVRVPQR